MLKKFLHHLFIPHPGNNQRAVLLHHSSLIILAVIVVGIQFFISMTRKTLPNILGVATDIHVEKLLTETNERRKQAGLSELTLSTQLSQAAYSKAYDMFSKNYWAHYSPTGATPWDFINHSGYRYIYAGENLAKDFQESTTVVDAWMASPTHRANVLRPEYRDVGFAVVNGKLNGEETTLVVEIFGTRPGPLAASAPESEQGEAEATIPNTFGEFNSNLPGGFGVNLKPRFDVVTISRATSLFIAGILFFVFISDGIVLWRRHVFRASGHNLAHMIFLGSLIGVIWFTGLGTIL